MAIYNARAGQVAYGYPLGMLCAEWNVPFIPGDLNNAWTFDFPMRYQTVPGAVGSDVLSGQGDQYADLFVRAAQALEAEGVRAITGNCGYMAAYQRQVAASVNIPVFMTSLLQLPMLKSMIGPDEKVAVLCASGSTLTPELFNSIGITDLDGVVIRGMDEKPYFNEVYIQEKGTLDEDRVRTDVVATAKDMLKEHPNIGIFLFECSDLPPYSAAVYEETGIPVFDWAGFIRYVYDAVSPRKYTGLF